MFSAFAHRRERHRHPEQITVQIDFKAAVLQFGQALGYGQTQPAAIAGTGQVTAHKAFRTCNEISR